MFALGLTTPKGPPDPTNNYLVVARSRRVIFSYKYP